MEKVPNASDFQSQRAPFSAKAQVLFCLLVVDLPKNQRSWPGSDAFCDIHVTRFGHPALTHATSSSGRQNKDRPIRIGGGIKPSRFHVRQVRTEQPHRWADWVAVSNRGVSLWGVVIGCPPQSRLL